MNPVDILCWLGGIKGKDFSSSKVRVCASEEGCRPSYLQHMSHLCSMFSQAFEPKENGFAAIEVAVDRAYWQQKRLKSFLEPSDKAVQVCSNISLLAQVQPDGY